MVDYEDSKEFNYLKIKLKSRKSLITKHYNLAIELLENNSDNHDIEHLQAYSEILLENVAEFEMIIIEIFKICDDFPYRLC